MKEDLSGSSVQKGMDWVIAALQSASAVAQMQFDDCHWEIDTMFKNEKHYSLIVFGKDKRKAVKLFSLWELENCPLDQGLQEVLELRLLKILDFVACTDYKKTQHRSSK